jgi:hypothetical protein
MVVVSFCTWPVPFGSSLGLVTLIFITAIFTVSVTEGPTAPGVGAFDSADGPADRGGVLSHLARPVRLIVRVSNPNFHNGDFYGLGNRRPHGPGGGCVRLGGARTLLFDSPDGPADRGGVLSDLARAVRVFVRVSNPN